MIDLDGPSSVAPDLKLIGTRPTSLTAHSLGQYPPISNRQSSSAQSWPSACSVHPTFPTAPVMSKRKSDLTQAGAATISPNFISPNLLNNTIEDEMTVQLLGAGQEVSAPAHVSGSSQAPVRC